MNALTLMLLTIHLSLGLLEMLFFQFCAVLLGFCIHFFIVSRRNTVIPTKTESPYAISEADEWKLKYFDELEKQEKTHEALLTKLDSSKKELSDVEIELENVQLQNIKLIKEQSKRPAVEDLAAQLAGAREALQEKDAQLAALQLQLDELKKWKKRVYAENAVTDPASEKAGVASAFNMDALHLKLESLTNENKQLVALVADKDNKLHAYNFQRQQLMRKITLLEELNHDIRHLGDGSFPSSLHEEITQP